MKTILLSLVAFLLLSSCNESDSCHCNIYQLTLDDDGHTEQTLVDSKNGICTEEDIAGSSMVEEVGCK